MAADDYIVWMGGRKHYPVRATSLLAAGWEFTRNPPPRIVVGPNTVQFTGRAGHPLFPWEGRIKQGDAVMYCRIGYDVDGVRHSQDIALRAHNEDFARRICGLKSSEIKSFEAQYEPFDDDTRARAPRDRELHDEYDWDNYGL